MNIGIGSTPNAPARVDGLLSHAEPNHAGCCATFGPGKMMAGVNLVHVPFGGNGPALTALLGGQVKVSVASLPSSIEYIRTGKLRGLASLTNARMLL